MKIGVNPDLTISTSPAIHMMYDSSFLSQYYTKNLTRAQKIRVPMLVYEWTLGSHQGPWNLYGRDGKFRATFKSGTEKHQLKSIKCYQIDLPKSKLKH